MPRCLKKAWLPKKLIQFYHAQSGDLAKLPGEGRLARSSGTNNDYAPHTDQFSLERGRHSVSQSVLIGCFFMALSFSEKVLKSKQPVVLFHTWTVTRELLGHLFACQRSGFLLIPPVLVPERSAVQLLPMQPPMRKDRVH